MPTAEFEAFRLCAKNLHTTQPSLGINVKVDTNCDENDMLVGESLSVKEVKSGKQLYRINLHLTTSVVSVNGGKLTQFTDCHIERIVKQMENMGNFKEINKIIREKLQEAEKNPDLKQLNHNNTEQHQATNKGKDENNQHKQTVPTSKIVLAIGEQEKQQENDQPKARSDVETSNIQPCKAICYKVSTEKDTDRQAENNAEGSVCSVCEESCTEERVLCDTCGYWSHYRCESLSSIEIKEMERTGNSSQTYTCRGCLSMEAMIRSDIVSEESSAPDTQEESDQTNLCDKSVSTTPVEKRDVWTNTAEQQDNGVMQKEHNKVVKQMESEIKRKEENISDLAKQLATARAYIITLEQKINGLEKSKNLQDKTSNNIQQVTQPADSDIANQRLSLLEQRLNAMEITSLKERMSALERRVGPEGNTTPNNTLEHQSDTCMSKTNTGERNRECGDGIVQVKSSENMNMGTADSAQNQHFLGKRPHPNGPPWEIQGEHSQQKKRKKKKKKPTMQVGQSTQPNVQNITQREGVQMEQRNLHHTTMNVPYMLDTQPLQRHHMAHIPQRLVTNGVTPMQHTQRQALPWLVTHANHIQNLQRGMNQNREVFTSYMSFQ